MNFSKRIIGGACLLACLFSVFQACNSTLAGEVVKERTALMKLEDYYQDQLDSASKLLFLITKAENDSLSTYFRLSRSNFKKAEAILAFADKHNYLSLNQPNFLKVDEDSPTDIKRKKAFGYQVLDELLLEEEYDLEEIRSQAFKTANRLKLIKENISLNYKDYHIFWMLRDQVVRIATLGLSGFDSPSALSLQESADAYFGLAKILSFYKDDFQDREVYKSIQQEFARAERILREGHFDEFDRYAFIKEHSHVQLKLFQNWRADWQIEFPFEMAIYSHTTSLFTDSTFNIDYFSSAIEESRYSKERAALGKKLFKDPKLSASGKMSCSSCHQESRAFTDGLVHFEGQKRNTPALTYTGLQKAYFYDNRAGSLEGQIVGVIENEHEFHTDLESFTKRVLEDEAYVEEFEKSYAGKIDDQSIRNAIAIYVRSLSDFNSEFDRNINGKESSLSDQEKLGFNLFLGKAQCGTCHFPPSFNGTVPPYYTDSEMELIGVPESAEDNRIDDDLGRYDYLQTEERKFFFKTPGIRNIALTAPYMHNGIYNSLEEVVEFYNHGGGIGMGMDLEYQTLPPDSLHLSEKEQSAIVAFMRTLTDERFVNTVALLEQ